MRWSIQLAVLAALGAAVGSLLLWAPTSNRGQTTGPATGGFAAGLHEPADPSHHVLAPQGSQQPVLTELTIDEIWAGIAEEIPGFAGIRLGPDGQTIQVFFVGEGDDVESAALRAVSAAFQARGAPAPTKIEVLPAEYDFAELSTWYRKLTAGVWTVPGIVFTDIDEVRNRLSIGVETQEAWELLEQRLDELGIPREVVHIEISGLPIVDQVGRSEGAQ